MTANPNSQHPHIPPPPPPLNAFWFYTSSLPIDDPLSPIPVVAPTGKQNPRPFAAYDSAALESAYQELLTETRSRSGCVSAANSRATSKAPPKEQPNTTAAPYAAVEGHPKFEATDSSTDLEVAEGVKIQKHDEITSTLGDDASSISQGTAIPRRKTESTGRGFESHSSSFSNTPVPDPHASSAINVTPTRNPFIRSITEAREMGIPPSGSPTPTAQRSRSASLTKKPAPEPKPPLEKEVPVGVQRLHKVLLPSFVMAPIYWSPLNDVAAVLRGTWFYKDTMMPVETEIANRLETGWQEVQAWTEEWDIELASAVEVGIEGEEKVRWQLWDDATISAANSRPSTGSADASPDAFGEEMDIDSSPTIKDLKKSPTSTALKEPESKVKPNPWDWVLFANANDAYVCRDTMLSFGNKRPLAQIRRGRTIGTHVVRGFCEKEWLKLHPPKRKPAPVSRSPSRADTPSRRKREKLDEHASLSASALETNFEPGGRVGGFSQQTDEGLGLDENEEERGKVTDLFLVIHGIGQKLSERVESFHFTNATHSLRRLVNLELLNESITHHLRPNVGMMVLPVNWRHGLNFDDGIDGASDAKPNEMFSLDDITPPTIPAVRNLIGDVMLDIPYYLSHHKPKMVSAVIAEANRVYRLWCRNNPGFDKHGRVHIIAHSLGSAIAMDILSRQATFTQYDAAKDTPSSPSDPLPADDSFLFQTINIFFIGSPAGFFLLLNRAHLLPRLRSPPKPSASAQDSKDPSLCADRGVFGSLAVDNIYNILHPSDPIAYRLNPCVDPDYSSTLRPAHVPSSSTSIFSSISSAFRWSSPSTTYRPSTASVPTTTQLSPQQHPTRLPSNLELETHDFVRESTAERRLYLLNDNGQLDWYLKVGGGLDNQYLGMLGAHSCYWENRDFARMIVVECGRWGGRERTLRVMRVVKKRGFQAAGK
ncbi:hypothetical protein EX30DRAFT_396620 [Ascodesmis nigricans]|uniref:DDHD domain-containing protein n=1 Tax=Ascodesmis nigricans TaxID=341454 RepID=A0A4S2MU30_9PEZI|nr:hypothetical protein EX30DRAFT_396620 [Ascodesmis nigricans]